MKSKINFVLSFIFVGLFFLVKPGYIFSQMKDFDEERLTVKEIGISELVKSEEPKILTDQEVKYVAGKDKLWFTDDDEIYHYFLIDHDVDGKVIKRSCKKVGYDTVFLTSDDILQDYQIFKYSKDGRLVNKISFNGQDILQYKMKYFYDKNGKKQRMIKYNSKNKEDRLMEFVYDEKGLLVKDVERIDKKIEKYHRFEYDNEGKIKKAMEYHAEKNGKGEDDIWFTDDDIISSTKRFFYDDAGVKIRENKYIGAGIDSQWFTQDDVLQYYVLFEYQK